MGVAGFAGGHGVTCGLDDRLGRRKVGLAETQVDHFLAGSFEFLGPLHDFHGQKGCDLGSTMSQLYVAGAVQVLSPLGFNRYKAIRNQAERNCLNEADYPTAFARFQGFR